MPNRSPVLVTGATGYIGGRLVPRLLEAATASGASPESRASSTAACAGAT